MRKKIVAGNWKMNSTIADGQLLVKEIAALLKGRELKCEVVVAPPFTHLERVARVIEQEGAPIKLAAQNCASKEWGAYTGEVSAKMLAEIGCSSLILGHSERRSYFGEGGEELLEKVKMGLESNLEILFCVGESLEEREEGRHFEVVAQQLKEVLFQLDEELLKKIVVAYEPVWAIGTGKSASADEAQEMHASIREVIRERFPTIADRLTILYGGSCNPDNAGSFFAKESIDGGLIGGASLDAKKFVAIIGQC